MKKFKFYLYFKDCIETFNQINIYIYMFFAN